MPRVGDILPHLFPVSEFVSETKSVGQIDFNATAGGGNRDHVEIAMYNDLAAISINIDGQCDSGTAVDKQPYNPYPVIDEL